MKRNARIKRLDGIWLEYLAASSATILLEQRLVGEPSFGSTAGWRRGDATRWRENLQGTYLIRMYAEFEVNLRDAWKGRFRQASQPPMKDLLASIAARMGMPESWMIDVDEVRIYRKSLIHSRDANGPIITIDQARSRLGRFLSRLPLDW